MTHVDRAPIVMLGQPGKPGDFPLPLCLSPAMVYKSRASRTYKKRGKRRGERGEKGKEGRREREKRRKKERGGRGKEEKSKKVVPLFLLLCTRTSLTLGLTNWVGC